MFSRQRNFSWNSPRRALAKLLHKHGIERKFIARGGFAAVAVAAATAYVASESSTLAEEFSANNGNKNPDVYLPTNDQAYDFRIFSANGNPVLANEIAMRLGCQLGRAIIGSFHDGEVKIRFYDSVRGKNCYIIQPTCYPPNDNLMELLLTISTLRRASAQNITAILPYYGYSRQLSPIGKEGEATSLAAADVALMLKTVGVDQVISVDMHRDQIEGFFDHDITVENLDTTKSMLPYLLSLGLKDPVCVSIGRVKKTKYLRDSLTKAGVDADMGFLFYQGKGGFENINDDTHPDESDPTTVLSHTTEFVGDVKGRDVLILTDLIDTGARVTSAADHLQGLGANRIFALTTHGVMTGNCVEVLESSAVEEVVMFNTIPLKEKTSPKIRVLSIAPLLAETISRVHTCGSVKDLY